MRGAWASASSQRAGHAALILLRMELDAPVVDARIAA